MAKKIGLGRTDACSSRLFTSRNYRLRRRSGSSPLVPLVTGVIADFVRCAANEAPLPLRSEPGSACGCEHHFEIRAADELASDGRA
jgi:hypothetical protein